MTLRRERDTAVSQLVQVRGELSLEQRRRAGLEEQLVGLQEANHTYKEQV